jgi:hypothetical protein
MAWHCGEENCSTHSEAWHRHQAGKWYCGRVIPPCNGHLVPGERCVSGSKWTCGSSACPMNHSDAMQHCAHATWYCGRTSPPCNGHRSWEDRCERDAILLLDGAIEATRRAFEGSMTFSSNQTLLYALRAYYNFRAVYEVTQPYYFVVDFGLHPSLPRGIVYDMQRRRLHAGPFHVAHGVGSGGPNSVPNAFSNALGSNQTSLGLYLTGSIYNFRRYGTIGLRLDGHSGEFNGEARRRGIVMHGAPYVTAARAGTSHGCPAVELSRDSLIRTLAGGSVVLHFSPNDAHWVQRDPWIHFRGYPATNSGRQSSGGERVGASNVAHRHYPWEQPNGNVAEA